MEKPGPREKTITVMLAAGFTEVEVSALQGGRTRQVATMHGDDWYRVTGPELRRVADELAWMRGIRLVWGADA